MALGAWRLMKMGIIVKQMKTVETLGSATVICTDKTGTLTENKMSLAKLFVLSSENISNVENIITGDEKDLVRTAMWASEPIPFDPMEISLHDVYAKDFPFDERPNYQMVHEYPLGGKPPLMTHVFEDDSGRRIIAAKGAPEAIVNLSSLAITDKQKITSAIDSLTKDGYRVLGVAEADFNGDHYPEAQQEFKFNFKGVVANFS